MLVEAFSAIYVVESVSLCFKLTLSQFQLSQGEEFKTVFQLTNLKHFPERLLRVKKGNERLNSYEAYSDYANSYSVF